MGTGEDAAGEDLLPRVLEQLRAVVWVFDADHVCRWVSPSVRSLLSRDPASLVGTKAAVLHSQEQEAYFQDFAMAVSRRSSVAKVRRRILLPHGGPLWVDITIDPRLDDAGDVEDVTVTMVDVTDQMEMQERIEGMLWSALEPHIYLRAVRDDSGSIVDFLIEDANRAACEYLNTAQSGLEGCLLSGILTTTEQRSLIARYAQVVESGEPLALTERAFPRSSGVSEVLVDVRAVKVGDGLSLDWRDVTRRVEADRALARSEEHFRQLAESIGDVVRVFDLEGNHEWVSPSVRNLLGYSPESLIGTSAVALMHPDDVATVFSQVKHGIETQGPVTAPRRTRLRHADGHWVWTETTNSFQYDENGALLKVYAVSRNAETQVRAEMDLKRMAQTDPLTGLLNRASVLERLEAIADEAPSTADNTAVLFCDIDGLKEINDSLGHAAGDAVIVAWARRCVDVGPQAVPARFGGDELLILLPRIQSLSAAIEIAHRLREGVEADAGIPDGGVGSSISIGVTLLHPGETADAVIARADTAMYEAKSSGRNRVVGVP